MESLINIIKFAAVIWVLGTGPVTAIAQTPDLANVEQLTELRKQLEKATNEQHIEQIVMSQNQFKAFLDNPDLIAQAHYFIGLAGYRLATLPSKLSDDRKEQYLDEAIEHLIKAIEKRKDFAEAHALLAGAYGMKAGGGMLAGMKYGPKSDKYMNKALELAPDNPRVLLLDGIGLLYTPSIFGGDSEKAVAQFKNAAKQFEEFTPEDATRPHWGRVEVYAWLGQAYEAVDQYDKAKEAYKKALELYPDYGWVKYDLMPKLAEKEK